MSKKKSKVKTKKYRGCVEIETLAGSIVLDVTKLKLDDGRVVLQTGFTLDKGSTGLSLILYNAPYRVYDTDDKLVYESVFRDGTRQAIVMQGGDRLDLSIYLDVHPTAPALFP